MLFGLWDKARRNITKRIVSWSVAFSFIFAIIFALGRYVDAYDTLHLNNVRMWVELIFVFVGSFITLISLLFIKDHFKRKNGVIREPSRVVVATIIVFCWLPIYLASFPGVFSYDSYEEWYRVATHDITSHHPVLHVLLLGGLSEFSNKLFGTGNVGIAVYVILQMGVYICIFTKLILFLKRKGVSSLFQWVAVAFYALSPVVSIFSMVTSKDSIFAIFELSFIIDTFDLLDIYEEKNKLSIMTAVRMVLTAFFAMIFRKNGIYIVVVTLLSVLIYKRKIFIDFMIKICIPLSVLYLLYIGPFYSIHNVKAGSVKELFSVPLQQIARVYKYESESLSAEEIEFMYNLVDSDKWDYYIPSIADPIKNGFHEDFFSENKVEFLKVWLEIGVKHPITYVNAFLANTVDTWYPYARIDGYRGLYGTDVFTSDFIDYRTAPPGEEKPILIGLHNAIKKMSISMTVTTNPLWSLFLTPGWYVVFWLVSLYFSIIDKKREAIPFHLAMFVSLGTILLGPVGAVRYLLIFYLVLPIEISLSNIGKSVEGCTIK